jgi:hypothetical protein
MDLAKDGPTLTSARQTGLQSMEDFMREQDEADAQRAVELAANLAAFPSKKQRKAALEAERKAIEQQASEAVKGLGAVNWVGRLIGDLITLNSSKNTLLNLLQSTAKHILRLLEG